MEVPYLVWADAQEPCILAASGWGQQRLAAWWLPVAERQFDDSCQKPCCCAWLHEGLGHGRGQNGAGPKHQEGLQKKGDPRRQKGGLMEACPRHQEGAYKEGDPRHEAVGQKARVLQVGLE